MVFDLGNTEDETCEDDTDTDEVDEEDDNDSEPTIIHSSSTATSERGNFDHVDAVGMIGPCTTCIFVQFEGNNASCLHSLKISIKIWKRSFDQYNFFLLNQK